jgi:hypothetical protein
LNVNYECPQNKPGKRRGKKPSKQEASFSSILATAAEDCEGISCNALKLRTSKKKYVVHQTLTLKFFQYLPFSVVVLTTEDFKKY